MYVIRGLCLRTFCEANYVYLYWGTVERFEDRVNRPDTVRACLEKRKIKPGSCVCAVLWFLASATSCSLPPCSKSGVGQASGSFHHKFCLHLG